MLQQLLELLGRAVAAIAGIAVLTTELQQLLELLSRVELQQSLGLLLRMELQQSLGLLSRAEGCSSCWDCCYQHNSCGKYWCCRREQESVSNRWTCCYEQKVAAIAGIAAVSYTHLTLPTILRV